MSVVQMVAVVSSIALALSPRPCPSGWSSASGVARGTSREARRSPSPDDRTRAAAWCGMGVYGGIIVVALVLSQVIGQAILYYRYLYVRLCFPLFFRGRSVPRRRSQGHVGVLRADARGVGHRRCAAATATPWRIARR